MIRFIYGESGYGKTHRIIELLSEDSKHGNHSFLIVPEQSVVASERTILNALPPEAQLSIEVLSFSRLYNRVCREYGGLEYNYITTPAKHLLMWKTLSELSPMLEHYTFGQSNDSSMSDFMLNTVLEFKANGILSEDIEAVTQKLDRDSGLCKKLRDISLIYAAYTSMVSQSFSDSSDNISKLSAVLKENWFFKSTNVYIDGFTSFTSPEHKVIEQIFKQADNSSISISLPSPKFSSVYTCGISSSECRLTDSADKFGGAVCEILTENKRAKSRALEFLSKNLWELSSNAETPCSDYSSVHLEMCASPYAEAEAAARWALELVKNGYRYRDTVIVMRDAEKYRGIIEPALEINNIPFYFSEKSDLCSKPSVKFLLSALRIQSSGWKTSDVISHLKTQIYDIPQYSIDLFESYVNTWSIKGNMFTDGAWTMNPDGYSEQITERGKRILEEANRVREFLCEHLIPLFTKLSASENAVEMCRAIYEYLLDANVEGALAKLAEKCVSDGNIKEAKEYSVLYQTTLDTLSLTAEILGEDDISITELAKALRLVFEKTEIGTIPTSVDEVTVGSASTIRADNPKCVIILGLCEGEFPKNISDGGALSSHERNLLSELGLELSSDDTKASDELLFVKKAFSLPSEHLILMSSLTESDGRAAQPSLPYFRTKKLLPNAAEHMFDENDLTYLCTSPESAARYIQSQPSGENNFALLTALDEISDEYKKLYESYLESNVSAASCRIDESTAKTLFPDRMILSQSRLEKYVKCHFSYYCSYVLGLREEKRASFGASDIGTFIHFILENLIKNLADENGIKQVSKSELQKLTDETVESYIRAACPAFKAEQGRSHHLYLRLRNLSLLLAENILEEFSYSEFIPAFFELKIKKGSSLEPLEFRLKDGGSVSLSGIIDRVDLFKKDGKTYVRVVDYKTGNKDFSPEELNLGLNTQLLIYLFTLCSEKSVTLFDKNSTETIPAGMVYLSSNIPTIELDDYTEPEEILKKASKAFSRSGLLLNDKEILSAMNENLSRDFLADVKTDKEGNVSGKSLTTKEEFDSLRQKIEETVCAITEEMKSGNANAVPLVIGQTSPCDYCEMRPVCKIPPQ